MKQNILVRIGQYFFYLLMAVCVVLIVLFYLSNQNTNPDDSIAKQMVDFGPMMDIMIYWVYILLGIAILAAVGIPLVGMITNPKRGLKTLISVVILGVILFAAYQLGSGEELELAGYSGPDNIYSRLKLTDMVIFSVYALLGVSILSLLYSSVSKLLK
ncbi:MAG: hypothetical protein M0P69_02680 [Bacteroidales bacterium]|jgi:hypothetical protein|nr:hypothetical protein [Bacteroidales bacterium]MDD2569607.1 hypothetical protein [Bacteroidales bacterium]MDD2812215.1 hypothetical protein [Bacteroidales bacterium]MDD3384588.1 hypothetical protein [Bacteroidales bacterium]MDD3811387.1 hypothetical protein [Bacteroidales bacterium]